MANEILQMAFDEVSNAPEAVGIYAWYGALYAPLADYKRTMDENGTDLGAGRLRAVLARHLSRYQLAPFRLSGRGSFGADWRGSLEDRAHGNMQDLVLGRVTPDPTDKADHGFAKSLANVSRKEPLRHLLSRALTEASPFLEAPIYIGMTKNLRRRLDEHVARYRAIRDTVANDDEKLNELRQRARDGLPSFAVRAIAMDFSPEHLKVYALNIEDLARESKITSDQMGDVATVAEWLLNRSHRPSAGRR
ncbi:hypothetical protein MOF7_16995 [Methylobacterium oryzae]